MREVEEKLEALVGEVRGLKQLLEQSKRASDLPWVLDYERAARELSVSGSTLKRMLAKGQIINVPRGDGFDPGIPRSEILRIAEGRQRASLRKRDERAKAPKGGSKEDTRAALRAAKARGD